MRLIPASALISTAFVVGALVPPALAQSYPSGFNKIAGGSASCSMIQASVNTSTERGGGRVSNFQGCNSSNPTKTIEAGRLRVGPNFTGPLQIIGYRLRCAGSLRSKSTPQQVRPSRHQPATTSVLPAATSPAKAPDGAKPSTAPGLRPNQSNRPAKPSKRM
jgi:hypothetical protein